MATLNIRRLPDDVHASLRLRAARAGRSMEAEARVIIAAACDEPENLGPADLQDFVEDLYGGSKPSRVVDASIEERRREARAEADAK